MAASAQPRLVEGLLDLLEEVAGLLVVGKGEASNAVFDLKRVEEDAVVVVLEAFVDLLIPQHARLVLLARGCQQQHGERTADAP